ncbi:hypothetical protein B0A55_05739 [Friedmanniomyces simplex]|uniref:Uncharacterized protein n=1 Tax=Friedmanniomyces simplex TaxID=329884 RepID=A0A4U0XBY0_9PEZI|nr:hypothetical protein B0A55_05739 [Friedmanniomyces simplex]
MDPIQHICNKLNAERARYQQAPSTSEPPPPYTPSDTDSDNDGDDDPEAADEDAFTSSPLRLTINAAHQIQGSNNLVPTSPSALADASKFSALLLTAVNQLNAAPDAKRRLKVDLTINCGITVIGDRNVIGNVGLKPKSQLPAQAVAMPGADAAVVASAQWESTVAGAKRNADERDNAIDEEEPDAKRVCSA